MASNLELRQSNDRWISFVLLAVCAFIFTTALQLATDPQVMLNHAATVASFATATYLAGLGGLLCIMQMLLIYLRLDRIIGAPSAPEKQANMIAKSGRREKGITMIINLLLALIIISIFVAALNLQGGYVQILSVGVE